MTDPQKPWKAAPPEYDADHLTVWSKNLGFLKDERYLAAYRRGINSGHRFNEAFGPDSLSIEWRVYVCCWAAMHAKNLPGDFVECGVNTGILSLAVCDYIDFNSTSKNFWLFDTFEGIPESQMSDKEKPLRRVENERFYADVWNLARTNFAPYPKACLIRGMVPDTLPQAAVEKACYLSIDMNIAAPEKAVIEYFWPKLVTGAVVILDDYAWQGYEEQKQVMDGFARSVGTEVLTLPTGQGLLVKF